MRASRGKSTVVVIRGVQRQVRQCCVFCCRFVMLCLALKYMAQSCVRPFAEDDGSGKT